MSLRVILKVNYKSLFTGRENTTLMWWGRVIDETKNNYNTSIIYVQNKIWIYNIYIISIQYRIQIHFFMHTHTHVCTLSQIHTHINRSSGSSFKFSKKNLKVTSYFRFCRYTKNQTFDQNEIRKSCIVKKNFQMSLCDLSWKTIKRITV